MLSRGMQLHTWSQSVTLTKILIFEWWIGYGMEDKNSELHSRQGQTVSSPLLLSWRTLDPTRRRGLFVCGYNPLRLPPPNDNVKNAYLAQAVKLLTYNREVPGSNLGRDIMYSEALHEFPHIHQTLLQIKPSPLLSTSCKYSLSSNHSMLSYW
jgi:hypothetical protein